MTAGGLSGLWARCGFCSRHNRIEKRHRGSPGVVLAGGGYVEADHDAGLETQAGRGGWKVDWPKAFSVSGLPLASDSTLVVAVARRHEAAFAELYRRHAGSLLCAALRVVSTRPLAEQLVQDLFAQLWRCPDQFQPEQGSLRAFLLAQCHRSAVDIVRSMNARLSHGGRNLHAVEGSFVSEDQLLDFVAGHRLRAAVATLREAEREAISLTYFGGRTCEEVAVLLDVPEETIRSLIRSGLARLRAALLEAGIDPLVTNTLVS